MRLLEQLERSLVLRRRSPKSIEAYSHWVRRFVRVHRLKHPKDMGAPEVRAFLEHLAVNENVAEPTQIQALCALVFLYEHVLDAPLGDLGGFARPTKPKHVPVVLTNLEARRILDLVARPHQLAARRMYGAGLRVGEVATLRIKDVDFERRELILRETKSRRDPRCAMYASLSAQQVRAAGRDAMACTMGEGSPPLSPGGRGPSTPTGVRLGRARARGELHERAGADLTWWSCRRYLFETSWTPRRIRAFLGTSRACPGGSLRIPSASAKPPSIARPCLPCRGRSMRVGSIR